jgi:hypothetical protein
MSAFGLSPANRHATQTRSASKGRGSVKVRSLGRWTLSVSFKRLILPAVLRHVSPLVIRLMSVPDHMDLPTDFLVTQIDRYCLNIGRTVIGDGSPSMV